MVRPSFAKFSCCGPALASFISRLRRMGVRLAQLFIVALEAQLACSLVLGPVPRLPLRRAGGDSCTLASFSMVEGGQGGSSDSSEVRKSAILAELARAEGAESDGARRADDADAEEGAVSPQAWVRDEWARLRRGEGEVAEFLKEFVPTFAFFLAIRIALVEPRYIPSLSMYPRCSAQHCPLKTHPRHDPRLRQGTPRSTSTTNSPSRRCPSGTGLPGVARSWSSTRPTPFGACRSGSATPEAKCRSLYSNQRSRGHVFSCFQPHSQLYSLYS